MKTIEINKEKCIQCGMCIKDCLTCSLEFDNEKYPKFVQGGEERCFACQHCMAICPTGALSFGGKNPKDADKVKFPKPDDVLSLIKSRRSIRQYKDEEISPEVFDKLKNMLPYIPTGCNTNTLHFSIIESKSAMDKIREKVRLNLIKLLSNPVLSKLAGKFAKYKTNFENGEDLIFRGAPHIIVVSSSIHAPCANVDPIIALSYIELYAQSLGLGTCWCGFAQACFKLMPEFGKVLDIPDGYKPVYVMLLGIPDVKYTRTTIPESFPISEIREIEDVNQTFTEKARRLLLNLIR